jgi:hypothetical protein
LPRFREQEIAEKFAHVLEDVSLPEEVVQRIGASLQRVHVQARSQAAQERARLQHALEALHGHMDAANTDKLDGKIPEGFWQRRQTDWQTEELALESRIEGQEEDKTGERLLNVQRI